MHLLIQTTRADQGSGGVFKPVRKDKYSEEWPSSGHSALSQIRYIFVRHSTSQTNSGAFNNYLGPYLPVSDLPCSPEAPPRCQLCCKDSRRSMLFPSISIISHTSCLAFSLPWNSAAAHRWRSQTPINLVNTSWNSMVVVWCCQADIGSGILQMTWPKHVLKIPDASCQISLQCVKTLGWEKQVKRLWRVDQHKHNEINEATQCLLSLMLLLLQAVPDKGIQAEVRGNRQIHSDTHVTLSFLATAQNMFIKVYQ